MCVAVGSVIYDAALPYLRSFLDSLMGQQYHDFIVLLINDGVERSYINSIFSNYYPLDVVIRDVDGHLPPERIRTKLIAETKEQGCEYLVFCDADDWCSDDRIEQSIYQIKRSRADFVYNEILSGDGKSIFPSLPINTVSAEDIIDYNFLGLSNTTIRVENLDYSFIYSLNKCPSHVFDWYLFSRMLLDGAKGCFVEGVYSYYRIHENNFVGVPHMSRNMVSKEVEVKTKHYDALKPYNKVYGKYEDAYKCGRYDIVLNSSYYWWNLTKGRLSDEI